MGVDGQNLQPPQSSKASPLSQTVFARFLAAHGGPFYELQKRLSLLHDHALKTGRRASIFVAVAWGVPFLLSLPASLSLSQGSYLVDPGPWARFFVAIAAFVLAEQQVERGLRTKLTQFFRAPIIPPSSASAAAKAVNTALKRRDSPVAEVVCLALAAAAAFSSYLNLESGQMSLWAAKAGPDGIVPTAAGWWSICISMPLFTFLFLRALWRHFVWAWLLRDLAKLELRLVATHPDGKGGLSFLADYPNAYVLFVLGTSSAVAAAVARHLVHDTLTATTFSMMMSGWLAIVLALFAYPLSAFSAPLAKLKNMSLLMLGAQATRYHRSAERKLVGRNVAANSEEETEADGEITDPSKQFDMVKKQSSMLLNRSAVIPVAAAALLPFAVAGATQLPFKEVLSVVKKLLLL